MGAISLKGMVAVYGNMADFWGWQLLAAYSSRFDQQFQHHAHQVYRGRHLPSWGGSLTTMLAGFCNAALVAARRIRKLISYQASIGVCVKVASRHNTPMRKLYLSLLLPLFLLISQQGALLHELSHYQHSGQTEHQKQHPGGEHCKACLSFAHIAGAAKTESLSVPLLVNLSFHYAAAIWSGFAEAPAPAPRSRGPPAFL